MNTLFKRGAFTTLTQPRTRNFTWASDALVKINI